MALEKLEMGVRLLEDIEAIKKLQAAFCYANDDDDWQGVADLFVKDGVAEFGPFGHHEGKEEIGKFFRELPPSMPFRFHTLHNPIIEVKGGKATGEWTFETSATHGSTNRALWIAGKYEVDYVKVDGEWKFKTFAGKFHYSTPYDEGWVKTKMHE